MIIKTRNGYLHPDAFDPFPDNNPASSSLISFSAFYINGNLKRKANVQIKNEEIFLILHDSLVIHDGKEVKKSQSI